MPARITVELEPDEVRRGANVSVAVRVTSTVPALFMRIIDEGTGLVTFRTMRITRAPTRRQDFDVGTRFMPAGRTYTVSVSASRTMRNAGHARFTILHRRGPIPLALLLPMLMGTGGVAERVGRGGTVEPRLPPGRRTESRPPPGRDSRARDWWNRRVRDVRGVRVQDPWRTGSPYTREQVERVLERERARRKRSPHMKPLPEGSVEDVMAALARDRARQVKKRKKYDLSRPVKHYVFLTEQDTRVCRVCMGYHGREWAPWVFRPAIPIHPNCRCRYERVWEAGPRVAALVPRSREMVKRWYAP